MINNDGESLLIKLFTGCEKAQTPKIYSFSFSNGGGEYTNIYKENLA